MADERQIAQQILFALDQLSQKNGHHEFEHLCRALARKTICTNILPATGPVSGGGDQGRDFETFRTYISKTELHNSAFVGSVSEGDLAFACTLQRDRIPSKIKADVTTILNSGLKPNGIYVYLSQGLSVARRHELQAWATGEKNISLQIIDGEGISELLCDPELFWIAESYLSIPGEIRPHRKPEEIDCWYEDALVRWQGKNDYLLNPANFHELVSAVRHATYTADLQSDVPLWIECLDSFRSDAAPEALTRRATYEIAVASLRGLGDLLGREVELRSYFDEIERLNTPAEFEDAAVLIAFCSGAIMSNALQFTLDELRKYHQNLVARLDERLALAETTSTKCALLNMKGYALFCSLETSDDSDVMDMSKSVACWTEMLDLVSGAPLFPLDRFADQLTEIIKHVGEFPECENLTRTTDELLSARSGGFIAAEKCRDRAIAFYKQGSIVRAIRELHYAKIGWFADETLKGSVIAMLLLADWYEQLGLVLAAKQYSMAAAYIAVDTAHINLKKYAPKALLTIAECNYKQGNWLDFVTGITVTLLSHQLVPNQDATAEADSQILFRVLFNAGIVLMVGYRFAPDLIDTLETEIMKWDLEEYLEEVRPMTTKAWADKSDDELWCKLESVLTGRPFGDVGKTRTTTWLQLGVRWEVTYDNEKETIARAEEFVASTQIFMSEWAQMDLCFLRATVNVEICIDDRATESSLEAPDSNDSHLWTLKIPKEYKEGDFVTAQRMAMSHAVAIMSKISLLPQEKFVAMVEERFKEGVVGRVICARAYHELYLSITPDTGIDLDRERFELPEKDRSFSLAEHEELRWYDGPVQGYSLESSQEGIRNRYATCSRICGLTMERLSKDEEFCQTVRCLREDGWLDWHICVAITNVVLNYRIVGPAYRNRCSHEEVQQKVREALQTEETYDEIWIPIVEFNEVSMKRVLEVSWLSTLSNAGLRCNQKIPDFPAISEFMRHRMGYWSDDVEHDQLFGLE